MSTHYETIAENIVRGLFVNGCGGEGARLVIVDTKGHDLGGWCKDAVKSQVLRALNKPGKSNKTDDQLHTIIATMSPEARCTLLRLCQALVRTPKKEAKP